MKFKRDIDIQKQRIDIWKQSAVAVANAFNSAKPEVAIRWADKILDAFDERFNEQFKKEKGK